MKTVEYSPKGEPINDFIVEQKYQEFLNSKSNYFRYSNESIFSRIRLGVNLGEISCNDVQFKFKDEILKINEYGAIQHWPDGFCDICCKISEKILLTTINKTKKRGDLNVG